MLSTHNSQQQSSRGKKQRVEWVDFAKAISISLVTIIHFTPSWSPSAWLALRDVLHDFRVPALVAVSGFFVREIRLSEYLMKRISRLLIPFAFVGVVLFLIKFGAQQFVGVDNPVTKASLFQYLVNPIKSFAPVMWFLPALYIMGFCVQALRRFMDYRVVFILLTLFVFYVPMTGTVFDQARIFVPFYAIGVFAFKVFSLDVKVWWWLGGLALSVIGYCMCVSVNGHLNWSGLDGVALVQSLCGVGGIMCISKILDHWVVEGIVRRGLLVISSASMVIYLFHTVFESSARILVTKVGLQMILPFWAIALFVCGFGLVGPIFLKIMLIDRSKLAKRLILGE